MQMGSTGVGCLRSYEHYMVGGVGRGEMIELDRRSSGASYSGSAVQQPVQPSSQRSQPPQQHGAATLLNLSPSNLSRSDVTAASAVGWLSSPARTTAPIRPPPPSASGVARVNVASISAELALARPPQPAPPATTTPGWESTTSNVLSPATVSDLRFYTKRLSSTFSN